jgi:hypothetical protein
MIVIAMVVAACLAIPLLAIAIAHLLWGVGVMWPIHDQKLLARTVVGFPGIERMPPRYMSLAVGLLVLAACVIGFSVADHDSGGAPLTLLALAVGLAFLARGAVGYTHWWQAKTPEEPFRALDRKNYSPLCLALGAGFVLLVIMRLI